MKKFKQLQQQAIRNLKRTQIEKFGIATSKTETQLLQRIGCDNRDEYVLKFGLVKNKLDQMMIGLKETDLAKKSNH